MYHMDWWDSRMYGWISNSAISPPVEAKLSLRESYPSCSIGLWIPRQSWGTHMLTKKGKEGDKIALSHWLWLKPGWLPVLINKLRTAVVNLIQLKRYQRIWRKFFYAMKKWSKDVPMATVPASSVSQDDHDLRESLKMPISVRSSAYNIS